MQFSLKNNYCFYVSTKNEKLSQISGWTAGSVSLYFNSKGTEILGLNSIIWESAADS